MAWVIFGLIGFILLGIWLYIVITAPKKDSTSLGMRISGVQERTSVDINRFAAGTERKRSEARTGLNTQLNTESLTYIEMINQQTLARLAEYENLMSVERRKREDMMLQAMQANQLIVFQAASEWKVSPATYEKMVLEAVKHSQDIQIKLLDQRVKLSDQQMRIDEHFQMKLIEGEVEKWGANLDKEMAMVKRLLPYHEYNELSEMLRVAHGHLAEFKKANFPNEAIRRREKERLKARIKAFQDALKRKKENL